MLGESGSQLRRNTLFALVDLSNRIEDLFGRSALQQVTLRTSFQGALNFHVALEGRQHHYASIGKLVPDRDQNLDAIHVRKLQVQKENVRPMIAIAHNPLVAV